MNTIAEEFAKRLNAKAKDVVSELNIAEEVFSVNPVIDPLLFVGREKQVDDLITGVDSCLRGVFKKIILYGDPGVGKSSLAFIAGNAAQMSSRSYFPILLSLGSYIKGAEGCYKQIVYVLCSEVVSRSEPRESSEMEFISHCSAIARSIALNDAYSINDIITEAIAGKILPQPTAEKPTDKKELLKVLAGRVNKKAKVMVILDDTQKLVEDKKLLQEVTDMVSLEGWFSIMIMHTSCFNELNENHNELIKDAFFLNVPKLGVVECEELLRRRLFVSNKKRKDIQNASNYSKDLLPFKESAIETLARTTDGNPLIFIKYLKDAYLDAIETKAKLIDDEIILRVLKISSNAQITLTGIEKEVLEYIKSKEAVTIQEIAELRSTTRASAYFVLNDLYTKKLINKQRKGREMLYFFKISSPQAVLTS